MPKTTTLEITAHEIKLLLGVTKVRAKSYRNRAAKSGFKPKPGHRDLNLAKADALDALRERLERALVELGGVP